MLNKDEYNQDEYNNYYRQEAEGAGIKNTRPPEGGNGKLILLLTLIIIGVAGFFGFKMLNSSDTVDNSSKEVTTINTPTESIETNEEPEVTSIARLDEAPKEINIETQVANAIQQNMQSNQSESMSQQEIAKVVALVMSQMNQKKSAQVAPKKDNTFIDIEDDNDLMDVLSETNVDSVQKSNDIDYTTAEKTNNNEIKSEMQQVDTYNKVTVQNTLGKDELSKLSDEISDVINDADTNSSTDTASIYTQSIKKEVSTRSNEMRIIVVKKGDTLGKIAQRAYGNVMDYKKIYQANPDILNRPDRIYIGQKLRIPK